jgi:hypothetical protein
MTTIESPMELLTPAYNRHFHTLTLEDDAMGSIDVLEGKVYYNFPDDYADWNGSVPGYIPDDTKFNMIYHRTLFRTKDSVFTFRVNNNLIEDNVLFEFAVQPNGINNLLVLQGLFYDTTAAGFLGANYLDILACYNQWAYTFNNSFLSQYFKFEVYFDIDTFNTKVADATITLTDMKNLMYVKYVPIKGVYYNLSLTGNQSVLVTEGTGMPGFAKPNKSLLLQQPNHKINIYQQSVETIEQLFPNTEESLNKTLIQTYTTPIDKDINGEYKTYLNINKMLQRYLKTFNPTIGGVTKQTKYLLPYKFTCTESGSIIKNGYSGVGNTVNLPGTGGGVTVSSIVNYDRSIFSLDLDTSESDLKWVCNAAKDKLAIYTMKDYYKNEQTIVPLALTNQPQLKDSYFCNDSFNNSREFLSFIYKGDALPDEFTLLTKVTYEDGTTTDVTRVLTITPSLCSVYTVDVSPDVLGLRELANQNIVSWLVRVQVEDVDVIQPKQYNRIVNGLPNRFNVAFINQLGMWDTFTFTGDNDFNYNQSYINYRASQSLNPSPSDLITGNYNSTVVKGLSLKSSQLDKKHIEWLQELLDSPEIKVYNNNKLESYYITKSDIKMDSNKSLYTLNLELKRTIENNSINN